MDTVIDLRSLDPRFQSGLIFSFFEGLLQGNGFKLILGQNPNFITNQFAEAKITNANLRVSQIEASTWEVNIDKMPEPKLAPSTEGCCGFCAGEPRS